MLYLEVTGLPGSGKSSICDYFWKPDAIKWDEERHPREWDEFIKYTCYLLDLTKPHRTHRTCCSLVERSLKKIATVTRMRSNKTYIQTGLLQRGIGIGYRLQEKDTHLLKHYYELLPKPLGVVSLWADLDTIKHRNRTRNKQDRSFMVDESEWARMLGVEIMKKRNIPVLELDTRNPIEENRNKIIAFEKELRNE